ncbi:hypothetical protein N7523_001079 [Penicillium sp. IBT 18751x]|nr:hypothetical protein N7523_001079 [Penicillium sp. IBT 18751x]
MWVVDAIVSVFTCFGDPFIPSSCKPPNALSIPRITIQNDKKHENRVGSYGCGLIASHRVYALATIIASYILWSVGVPLASMVIVIYLMRLMLHKIPAKAVIASTFLPLGPLGQGGYG